MYLASIPKENNPQATTQDKINNGNCMFNAVIKQKMK